MTAEREQLVVPKTLRAKVLHLGHSIPWSGHLGKEKTESRIVSRCYWPGLHCDIAEYCKSCPECQLSARSSRGLKAPLISLPIIDIPFSRIAMDVVGPLERTGVGLVTAIFWSLVTMQHVTPRLSPSEILRLGK